MRAAARAAKEPSKTFLFVSLAIEQVPIGWNRTRQWERPRVPSFEFRQPQTAPFPSPSCGRDAHYCAPPRTDPYERLSRIRLLPRVFDGKPLPCGLPYAVQTLWRALPTLRSERAFLSRVPLGPRPSLHGLRRRFPGLVRLLRRYYGGVRLLTPVRHALRLFAFRMRTRTADGLWSGMRPPRFRRDPFVRDVAFDPGRATAPRMTAPHMLPSTLITGSAPAT